MKDLTQGSIRNHLLFMAIPMLVGMGVQTLYYLIDLYFVAGLGSAALAGVSIAGNSTFAIIGATQILSVSTVFLISNAIGRQDRSAANELFNQSLLLALIGGGLTLAVCYGFSEVFMGKMARDPEIVRNGVTYLHWYAPGMASQFILTALAGALRGAGVTKPAMMVQMLTVLLNILLAPVLIAGWGTGHPLGVAGAALASTVSVGAGVLFLLLHFVYAEQYFKLDTRSMKVQLTVLRAMLKVGVPAGGEFILMFGFSAYVYFILRDFGGAAQGGFGMGSRALQMLFLPALAVSFAVPAVAGQNFGAGLYDRVRETFKAALIIECLLMVLLTIICQANPSFLLRWFTDDQQVLAFGTTYVSIISLNFLASGILYACSGMFQAVGNTWPSLACAVARLVVFAVPLSYISARPGFEIVTVWHLSIATTALQAVLSMGALILLLRRYAEKSSPTETVLEPSGAMGVIRK